MSESLVAFNDGKPGLDAYTGIPTIDYIAYDKAGFDELLAIYPQHILCIRNIDGTHISTPRVSAVELESKPFPWVLSALGPDPVFKSIVLEAAGITEMQALAALLKQNEQEAKQGNYLMTTDNTNVNYFELIRQWGKDRDIIGGSATPIDQFLKGLTEAAELWGNVLGKEPAKLKDDIGDTLVCLTQSYGIIGCDIEQAMDEVPVYLEIARSDYGQFGEWALKRFSLRVLRALSSISWDVEAAQFESDSFDVDSLLTETAELIAVLTVIAEDHHWSLQDCLQEAYDDIKDRKGVMYNGGFVKEASLTVERAQEMLAAGTLGSVGTEYLNGYIAANS